MLPTLIADAGPQAQRRFLEFFAAIIRNAHTRRAYARGVGDFLGWCTARGVVALGQIQPLHVAAWTEDLGRVMAVPTIKLRLAVIRHLSDWLVTGQIVAHNPAISVHGPAHSVRRGKTPVLDPREARADRRDHADQAKRPRADRVDGL